MRLLIKVLFLKKKKKTERKEEDRSVDSRARNFIAVLRLANEHFCK